MDVLNLDYLVKEEDNDIEKIGEIRTVYWPVAVYTVMLPSYNNIDDENKLNPFEKVVLRLIDALGKTASEKEIAELTCLELDTVHFIILKLQDRGFIDYNLIIKGDKRKYLDLNEDSELSSDKEYQPAKIFRELYSGKLFPFIYFYHKFNAFKRNELNPKLFKIQINEELEKDLRSEDVINVLKRMKKHNEDFRDEYYIPKLNQIRIEETIEYYYLPCKIVILKSNIDYRILNPFQKGYSNLLENAFDKLITTETKYKNWLDKWYEDLSNSRFKYLPDSDDKNNNFWKKHPYKDYYSQLINNLTPARNRQFRDIIKIYSSIEWALFYFNRNHEINYAIDSIKFTNPKDLNSILIERAKEYGFEIEKNYDNKLEIIHFPIISYNRLNNIKRDNMKPDYDTMISIALLLEGKIKRIRKLAEEIPNFLWKMKDLKDSRNIEAHNKKEFSNEEVRLPDDIFMQKVVSILLPEVIFPNDSDNSFNNKKYKNIDSSLIAKSNIRSFFSKYYDKMSKTLSDRLLGAETFFVSINKEKIESLELINHLYASLQILLSQVIGNIDFDKKVPFNNYFDLADKKAINCGFSHLPDNLKTVSKRRIKDTFDGIDCSLGACLIAFIILVDEDILTNIHSDFPDFIESINKIEKLRGHGNTECSLNKSEIVQIRKNVYLAIEKLMEVL